MAASAMSARIIGCEAASSAQRFASIDDLARRISLRRDEITVLAEVGALNSFGMDRRSALWQVERVIRPAGELFEGRGEVRRPRPRSSNKSRLAPGNRRP